MKYYLYSFVSILIILSSCSKNNSVASDSRIISIDFTQTVDGATLLIGKSCGESGECHIDDNGGMPCCAGEGYLPYTNAAGEKYNIQTLKYIISNIILHDVDGNAIPIKDVHFVDLSDELTLQFEAGELSNGNYKSLSFSMGLEDSVNISNAYLNEFWHSTMAWPDMMGGGYHYMKLEGSYNNDSTFYNTHTGGAGGMDYAFNIDLPISLNTENNLGDITFSINMEVNNWYENPNIYNLSGAIMGDMSKQIILQQNGLADVFSISIN